MLFDAHTHLNFEKYTEEERRGLASEIEASDVAYIIDVADCVASAVQALKDADDYPWCYADREEQQELFRKQIRLANELRMPIMIHSRDAHQLTMDILKEEGAFSDERKSWFTPRIVGGKEVPDARVQMHCFSGSPELAHEYVKLGATISLGGPVTFKNGKKAAEVVRQIPIEYLLSETDAPYMAPVPLRGKPNKSPYIEHIVRRMALLKDMDYEKTAAILTENGKRFFNI